MVRDHNNGLLRVLLPSHVVIQSPKHFLAVHVLLLHECPELRSVLAHHVRNPISNVLISHLVVVVHMGLPLVNVVVRDPLPLGNLAQSIAVFPQKVPNTGSGVLCNSRLVLGSLGLRSQPLQLCLVLGLHARPVLRGDVAHVL